MDSIKDVVRSSVKVPEFDKRLKKAGGHIGQNLVEIIKMKTIVRKPLMIKINGGARGVMVIVVGNGHGDTSSNPGQYCLNLT